MQTVHLFGKILASGVLIYIDPQYLSDSSSTASVNQKTADFYRAMLC